jgi:regulatory protein YycI of two-component signal transduction system YycFG
MITTFKKYFVIFIVSILLISILSACGQVTKQVTVSEDNTNKETLRKIKQSNPKKKKKNSN